MKREICINVEHTVVTNPGTTKEALQHKAGTMEEVLQAPHGNST